MSDQDRIQQLEQFVRELQDKLKRTKDEFDAWKRGHRIRSGQNFPKRKNPHSILKNALWAEKRDMWVQTCKAHYQQAEFPRLTPSNLVN